VNWPLKRLILSTMGNNYVRAITGLPTRDCTGGFRAWRRKALEALPLDRILSDGYSFQVETLYEAVRAGATVAEVPIVFVERRVGESKLSRGVVVESLFMPWRLRLRGLSRK
jgi:dolichol-phosphate mannosyltransferase